MLDQTPSRLGPPEKKKNQAKEITATSPATAAPIWGCLLRENVNFFGLGIGCKVFADGCGWTTAVCSCERGALGATGAS